MGMCPWGNLGLLRSHFEWKVTADSSFKTTFSRLGARFSVEASFELQTDLFEVWLQKAFKVTFTRLRHRALNRHFRGLAPDSVLKPPLNFKPTFPGLGSLRPLKRHLRRFGSEVLNRHFRGKKRKSRHQTGDMYPPFGMFDLWVRQSS